jgi:hypothetical protein
MSMCLSYVMSSNLEIGCRVFDRVLGGIDGEVCHQDLVPHIQDGCDDQSVRLDLITIRGYTNCVFRTACKWD